MTKDLEGRVALITGSTVGIGERTARLFAEHGAEVIVSGRDFVRGNSVVADIRADGARARFVPADLTDPTSIAELAEAAGEIDILINNAAVAVMGPALDTDLAGFAESFQVNVRAPYLLVTALAPKMVAKGHGVIVNVSTMAATVAMPGMSIYSASKAALNSLTRTWAAELALGGVRVNTLAAGPTGTDKMLALAEMSAQVAATTLLQRLADPSEIAEVALFLASDRSSYLTGATIAADAGRTAA